MNEHLGEQRQLAVQIAKSVDDEERLALLSWLTKLLEIRESSLSLKRKARDAITLTVESKVIRPAAKLIWREVKRLAWNERGTKSRFSLIGMAIGLTIFGGQGAGIAALGTAIGVPLWVVLGAGGAFAGALIEELSSSKNVPSNPNTGGSGRAGSDLRK